MADQPSRPLPGGVVYVCSLIPGDVVTVGGMMQATFIARYPHPRYDGLEMVVWRLDDGSLSWDALDARQEVGTLVSGDRTEDLRAALGTVQPDREADHV